MNFAEFGVGPTCSVELENMGIAAGITDLLWTEHVPHYSPNSVMFTDKPIGTIRLIQNQIIKVRTLGLSNPLISEPLDY